MAEAPKAFNDAAISLGVPQLCHLGDDKVAALNIKGHRALAARNARHHCAEPSVHVRLDPQSPRTLRPAMNEPASTKPPDAKLDSWRSTMMSRSRPIEIKSSMQSLIPLISISGFLR